MIKVFLADDEIRVMTNLKKLIAKSQLPFEIAGEATDGLAAWEEIQRLRPEVLITDIRMPGLDGLSLVQKIVEQNLNIKTILISGYSEFEYARSALRLGAFDYLLKPIHPEELTGLLSSLLEELNPDAKEAEEELIFQEDHAFVRDIIADIQKKFNGEISLAQYSEKYNISTGYLSILLKKELGMSFTEYITSKRVEKACVLLKNDSLSIASIAEMTGYHDYFYFTKVFKKIMGVSPSKYRKTL